MKRQTNSGLVVGLLFLLTPLNLGAQEPVPPDAVQVIPTPPAIPDSRAEWTVEIRTSGGFTGAGNGGFTVTSAGGLTCNLRAPCSRQIPKPELQSIEGFINSANLPASPLTPKPEPQPIGGFIISLNPELALSVNPSVCSDCIMTTMYLRIRDSKGMEWSYVASWDLTTQSGVSADFKKIFQAATALTQ
jgi:hypothetical protein